MFDVGDNVVYPHHGAGTVVSKESRIVLGQEREYLTIKILHNDMTVNVPTENAEKVGLRWVIGLDAVEVVVKALSGESTEMPKNWNRRFKHNRDKMKTGDILELAEVVRNLALRDHEKGLSTGEKQMYVKAKKILASEFMYAKDMTEDEAAAWEIDGGGNRIGLTGNNCFGGLNQIAIEFGLGLADHGSEGVHNAVNSAQGCCRLARFGLNSAPCRPNASSSSPWRFSFSCWAETGLVFSMIAAPPNRAATRVNSTVLPKLIPTSVTVSLPAWAMIRKFSVF